MLFNTAYGLPLCKSIQFSFQFVFQGDRNTWHSCRRYIRIRFKIPLSMVSSLLDWQNLLQHLWCWLWLCTVSNFICWAVQFQVKLRGKITMSNCEVNLGFTMQICDVPTAIIVDFEYILSVWFDFVMFYPLGRNLMGIAHCQDAPDSTSILIALSSIFFSYWNVLVR